MTIILFILPFQVYIVFIIQQLKTTYNYNNT